MAKKKVEEKINLDSILFKCRDILRKSRNSGSFFEKRDMMLTLIFLRFIGEKFEDGLAKLREDLIAQGLDPDDEEIFAAFFAPEHPWICHCRLLLLLCRLYTVGFCILSKSLE